jgi:hypothetical protein
MMKIARYGLYRGKALSFRWEGRLSRNISINSIIAASDPEVVGWHFSPRVFDKSVDIA